MIYLVQLSPLLLTLILLLGFRWPPIRVALISSLLVILLWALHFGAAVNVSIGQAVVTDTLILFASAGSVIAPGLGFVVLVERIGVNKTIADWVSSLGWTRSEQSIFIVLGVAPALEAMTGFGVSLIATVPLLLVLFPRGQAIRIALTGMAIMPWGTLGLATIIGAALSGLSANDLGAHSAVVSAPVFLFVAALSLRIGGQHFVGDWIRLLGVWLVFVLVLYGINVTLGPELAGVGAGLAVAGVGFIIANRRGRIAKWPSSAWPYSILLAAIIVLKVLAYFTNLDHLFAIRGHSISWLPLTSPGFALIIVLAAVILFSKSKISLTDFSKIWARRAWKPLGTVFLFLFLSQGLLKGGFLAGLQTGLGQLGIELVTPLTAILAALSGYVTGSNVGGNAIFMPTVAHLPFIGDRLEWLAAIQNSGAGHGAMGSLAILAVISGLANPSRDEESDLVRFGFKIVVANAAIIMLLGSLILQLQGR